MPVDVIKYEFSKIKEILNKEDSEDSFDFATKASNNEKQEKLEKELDKYLRRQDDKEQSVLGIDIYKYSKYDYEKQKLIPFIFSLLRNEAEQNFLRCEPFLKDYYSEKQLEQEMIHTGDGGFFIFRNPLDAVIFSLFFNIYLHLFNSFHFYPLLRKYVGPITVRYTITYDQLYKIDSYFYGPAIIKNARIISKDMLNRFLIDNRTYEWFLLNTRGIENLPIIRLKELNHLFSIEKEDEESFLLGDTEKDPGIRYVFCQKLEKINVKDDDLEIYNLTIQSVLTCYSDKDSDNSIRITSTAGNMNCNGI